jgi:hypothetical protein
MHITAAMPKALAIWRSGKHSGKESLHNLKQVSQCPFQPTIVLTCRSTSVGYYSIALEMHVCWIQLRLEVGPTVISVNSQKLLMDWRGLLH